MLHQLRWRKPPPDRRRLWGTLAITLLLHVFFVVAVWYEMKPNVRAPEVVQVQLDQGIQVRFIVRSAAKPQAAPPPIAPPPPPPRPAREAVSKNAMTVQLPASPAPQPAPATSAPRPVLFDRTGRIVLPAHASSATTAPAAEYVQPAPQGDARIMRDQDMIKYKPTKLDPYWRKSGNAIDDALQKAVEKTTVKKTIQLPGGIRIHCGMSLAALAGGCGGDPPPPPPPTDGDERLNMAPAPLVKGRSTPKPDVATCIADYRAGIPLPYGCPVDTPTRAVDTEKKKTGT
ncbi:hypothetical protein [Dyella nitratireducens]|uniref:Energy transducer TonB n=1 Tax=Dyella nitratireducens TaxID=1849580 RepID=A0ABQ1G0H9_9GAMM|nr:hypothetical protein [Dyella nitratireducens]GGA34269.1 hypothetical protein GCM10010981_24070 [Dyella nitratireducens]GLQ40841.1 hypothetical protein GCM10007902_06910 [Dyella nitratireducens]